MRGVTGRTSLKGVWLVSKLAGGCEAVGRMKDVQLPFDDESDARAEALMSYDPF